MDYDVFICHASEDKTAVVEPLAATLRGRGLRVWLDRMEILIGDRLTERIDDGLAHSRFGVVIVSRAVLGKDTGWVRRELDGLAAREAQEGQVVVLPVWHGIGYKEVASYSPTLASKLAADTGDGLEAVAEMIWSRCHGPAKSRSELSSTLRVVTAPVAGEDIDRVVLAAEREAKRQRLTKIWDLIDGMWPLLDEQRPLFPIQSNWDRARRRLQLELEGLVEIDLPKCHLLVEYVGRRIDEKNLLVEARDEVSEAVRVLGAGKQRSS